MDYLPDAKRYDAMQYNRCGRSGVLLPAVSLGLWHNFGSVNVFENARAMVRTAFDLGITHFDLANNYGPVPGSAEITFGRVLKEDFAGYRDEMVISTKAGYRMWPGPYGDNGSKKYLLASLDQSLRRMGLDYVDIFYSHRPDKDTPIEETMEALYQAVRSGKALYAGISSYSAEQTQRAYDTLAGMGVKLLIHQPSYSMLNRWIEDGLQDTLDACGMGSIAFCPLAQGLLTDKYLGGVPEDSRAGRNAMNASQITPELLTKTRALNDMARERGQSLAQMVLTWTLRGGRVTSALIGASRPAQIVENVKALDSAPLSDEELKGIEAVLSGH